MHTILYSTNVARAATFEQVLSAAGYGPELRIVADAPSDEDVAASRACSIVFIDLALGTHTVAQLLTAIRSIEGRVPTLLALIGEPTAEAVDVLADAGANMYFPEEPERLALRMRFLRGAIERRGEIARLVAQLQAANERFEQIDRQHRELLERSPHAVAVYRDAKVAWCNSRFVALLGYSDPSELIGKPILDIAAPSSRQAVVDRLRARAEGSHDVPPLEISILRRDGTTIDIMAISIPALFDGERAIVSFVTNLTEQRKMEMRLVASDRMAALGRMAASVGHEINNPLTYLMGNLQLAIRALERGPGQLPNAAKMLDDALEGAERVRRIVQDLRVFSKLDGEEYVPVDVHTVIDSCVRMTAMEIQQRARLNLALDDALPPVRASEPRLAQVITNLLLNAAQAIPEGAIDRNTITVTARRAAADRVEIRIDDTGPGIAPEHLPHVFEPFFSTKLEAGGTGLGLSICKLLVAQQGGTIDLVSQLGRGTSVTVTFAVADGDVPDRAGASSPSPPIKTRRVLVIDDEPRVAQAMGAMLAPHDVAIALSGREALAILARAQPFDAIVCDLMMPDIGGAELYEQIRANYPGLEHKLVFVTGGVFTPAAARFVEHVPNLCLQKPFSIGQLIEAIERVA